MTAISERAETYEKQSPERCVKRIENAVGILSLRVRPNGIDVLPAVASAVLVEMILLDAASLLDHFRTEEACDAAS